MWASKKLFAFVFLLTLSFSSQAYSYGPGFYQPTDPVISDTSVHCYVYLTRNIRHFWKYYTSPRWIPKNSVLIVMDGGGGRQEAAADYYHTHKPKAIIVTGTRSGTNRIINYMVSEGVPRQVIIQEGNTGSTGASASATARILQNRRLTQFPLVSLTHNWHSYRTYRLFQRYNINLDYTYGIGNFFNRHNPVHNRKMASELSKAMRNGLCPRPIWGQK